MKTFTVEADIAPDGMLQVTVPSGLPPGRVEVVLVIQPKHQNGASLLQEQAAVYSHAPQVIEEQEPVQFTQENTASDLSSLTERERLTRLMELLDIALVGVTWEEIEEGRRDRDFGD